MPQTTDTACDLSTPRKLLLSELIPPATHYLSPTLHAEPSEGIRNNPFVMLPGTSVTVVDRHE